ACEVYRVYDEERDSLTHRAAPDTGPEVRAVDVHPALLTGCGHGVQDHVRHGLGLGTITTFDHSSFQRSELNAARSSSAKSSGSSQAAKCPPLAASLK